MNVIWGPFRDGFVGAFVLTWDIVVAVARVCSAFVHSDDKAHQQDSAATGL